MKGEGVEPTEATYGNCISALAKSGDFNAALKHFDEMLLVRPRPGASSPNS
jgi:pentatricopeptide repeat protein